MIENPYPDALPTVTTHPDDERTVRIAPLHGDRHHDLIFLGPKPRDGDSLSLTEAQTRDLHAKLGARITVWDRQDNATPHR